MAVSIQELIIKTSIASSPKETSAGEQEQCDICGGDKVSIIEECVEQVLEILKEKEER
ncbi:MAG: DUF5908 family protein [Lentisphaeraceae bacterium]|nr:DUF5908 family protein [Lentisphaeraceae bacterium]